VRYKCYVCKWVDHIRDVRVDTNLNKFVWSTGVKNVPTRVRVRLSRRRNEDEDAKEKVLLKYRPHIFLSASLIDQQPLCAYSCTH
jgi:ribosomal protein L31E